MKKISRLEAMRAARDQREQEVLQPIVQPLRQQVSAQRAQMEGLRENLDAMSSIVTSEIGPRMIPDLRDMILQKIEQQIYEAMAKASGRGVDEVITVPLLASMVRFQRPDELTRDILDKAASTYGRECKAVGSFDSERSVTYLRVTLPKVEAQVAIGHPLPRRRRIA